MSDPLLLQYLKDIKDGQDDLATRVGNIETALAERRGEKRIENKVIVALAGAVSILTTAAINYLSRHSN